MRDKNIQKIWITKNILQLTSLKTELQIMETMIRAQVVRIEPQYLRKYYAEIRGYATITVQIKFCLQLKYK